MNFYFKLNSNQVAIDFLISSIETQDSQWIRYIAPPNMSVEMMSSLLGKFQYDLNSQIWSPFSPTTRILTKYEFNSRFTFEELVAIEEASTTDAVVTVLKNKFNIADNINLDEDSVIQGLNLLISKNLLTNERKNIILL